jgi:hypothetical protein
VAALPCEERIDTRSEASLASYICFYREQRIIRPGHSLRIHILSQRLSLSEPLGEHHYFACCKPRRAFGFFSPVNLILICAQGISFCLIVLQIHFHTGLTPSNYDRGQGPINGRLSPGTESDANDGLHKRSRSMKMAVRVTKEEYTHAPDGNIVSSPDIDGARSD